MARRELTGNEKLVLYGLVRHPASNDRELSGALGVKVSTVTAIRRRLRHAGYFVTRRIPMLHRLGWEILGAGHAPIDVAETRHAIVRIQEALSGRLPNLFYVAVAPDHLTFLAVEPDYTSLRSDVDDLRLLLDKAGLLGQGDLGVAVFAMALSAVPVFFDYGHVLAMAFGIEDRPEVKVEPTSVRRIALTRKELDVLKGLVRYPELSDKALAQRVKVSRQAVSKMRHRFESEGLLRTVRIPDLASLEFDLIVSGFSRFRPQASLRSRTDAIGKLLRGAPVFLVASCDAESVVLGAAKDYGQYVRMRGTIVGAHEQPGVLAGDPAVYLGLTHSTELIRNCDFGPAVQEISGPVPVRAGRTRR